MKKLSILFILLVSTIIYSQGTETQKLTFIVQPTLSTNTADSYLTVNNITGLTQKVTLETLAARIASINTVFSVEDIQDIIGNMVTDNTETNITVTYDDTTGKLNFIAEAGGGGGSIISVNSLTGVVVLDADDIDDTATLHKYVTQTDINKLANLSGTNTGDQDISGITTNSNNILVNTQDIIDNRNDITTIEGQQITQNNAIALNTAARGIPNDNSVTSVKILNGTIINDDINEGAAITPNKIAPSSTDNQILTTIAGVTSWANPPSGSGTDSQTLSLNGDQLSISNSNSVDLSNYVRKDTVNIINSNIFTIAGQGGTAGITFNFTNPQNGIASIAAGRTGKGYGINIDTLGIRAGNSYTNDIIDEGTDFMLITKGYFNANSINTDNQQLSLSGTALSLEDGGIPIDLNATFATQAELDAAVISGGGFTADQLLELRNIGKKKDSIVTAIDSLSLDLLTFQSGSDKYKRKEIRNQTGHKTIFPTTEVYDPETTFYFYLDKLKDSVSFNPLHGKVWLFEGQTTENAVTVSGERARFYIDVISADTLDILTDKNLRGYTYTPPVTSYSPNNLYTAASPINADNQSSSLANLGFVAANTVVSLIDLSADANTVSDFGIRVTRTAGTTSGFAQINIPTYATYFGLVNGQQYNIRFKYRKISGDVSSYAEWTGATAGSSTFWNATNSNPSTTWIQFDKATNASGGGVITYTGTNSFMRIYPWLSDTSGTEVVWEMTDFEFIPVN